MAIVTIDGLVAALPAQGVPFLKANFTPQAAASYMSLWATVGIPGAGANASSGVGGDVPTSATAGAIPFTNNLSSYLGRISAYANLSGQLLLYDRLWQNSGLSPTTLTAQTVTSTALTRPDANGAGAEAWFQVYTTLGAGSTVPSISYTDQDGNTGQTGSLIVLATTSAAQRTYPFQLAAGDTGVRAIATYTNGATMTSGTFGLIIRRFVAMLPIVLANTGAMLDPIGGGLPRIYDSACLEFLWQASGTSTATTGGNLAIAQG